MTGLEVALMTAIAAMLGAAWLFLGTLEPRPAATLPAPASVASQIPRSTARELDARAFEPAPLIGAGGAGLSTRSSNAPELVDEPPPFDEAEAPSAAAPSGAPALRLPQEQPAPRARSRGAKRDALVRALWHRRGLCADESGDAARARYIAAFGAMPVPALPGRVKAFLGLESEPPAVYVHKNPESLRAYSCVNSRRSPTTMGAFTSASFQGTPLAKSSSRCSRASARRPNPCSKRRSVSEAARSTGRRSRCSKASSKMAFVEAPLRVSRENRSL